MLDLCFLPDGWKDYTYWQERDRKTVLRINSLLRTMQRTPFSGEGKPEPLRGNLQGWWSRRIDESNCIVYKVQGDMLILAQLRGHYEK